MKGIIFVIMEKISWEKFPKAIDYYINEMLIMRGSVEYADAKNNFILRMAELMENNGQGKEEIKLLESLVACIEEYTDILTAY